MTGAASTWHAATNRSASSPGGRGRGDRGGRGGRGERGGRGGRGGSSGRYYSQEKEFDPDGGELQTAHQVSARRTDVSSSSQRSKIKPDLQCFALVLNLHEL